MKKQATETKKEEAAVKETKTEKVKKPRTNEMTQLNAMSKRLRMTAWRFVRRIQGSKNAEALMARLDEGYAKVEKLIDEMQKEEMIALRFAMMTDDEKQMLKALLCEDK